MFKNFVFSQTSLSGRLELNSMLTLLETCQIVVLMSMSWLAGTDCKSAIDGNERYSFHMAQ